MPYAKQKDALDLFNDEFKAGAEYAKQHRRISMTPPVDDDFPQVKFEYDQAARSLIDAFRANGRIA